MKGLNGASGVNGSFVGAEVACGTSCGEERDLCHAGRRRRGLTMMTSAQKVKEGRLAKERRKLLEKQRRLLAFLSLLRNTAGRVKTDI